MLRHVFRSRRLHHQPQPEVPGRRTPGDERTQLVNDAARVRRVSRSRVHGGLRELQLLRRRDLDTLDRNHAGPMADLRLLGRLTLEASSIDSFHQHSSGIDEDPLFRTLLSGVAELPLPPANNGTTDRSVAFYEEEIAFALFETWHPFNL